MISEPVNVIFLLSRDLVAFAFRGSPVDVCRRRPRVRVARGGRGFGTKENPRRFAPEGVDKTLTRHSTKIRTTTRTTLNWLLLLNMVVK